MDSTTSQKAPATQDEQRLVKLYMDLTGAAEAPARSVLMFVCSPEERRGTNFGSDNSYNGNSGQASSDPRRLTGLVVFLLALLSLSSVAAPAPARSSPQQFITSPLSLEDVVNIALQQNPAILRAQKDLEATQGITMQTKAIAIPKVNATGSYAAVQPSDIDTFSAPGVTFGNSQNWVSQVRLVQSLYEGGRMLSSFRVARLQKQQSMLNYRTVTADAVLLVQLAYYRVLLETELISVQEASIQLLSQQLADTTRRYEAGTVPRFNVLRAEVELANARPLLITARNNLRIAKNNLSNLLGFSVPPGTVEDIPLNLSGKLDSNPYDLPLQRGLTQALERRPELQALEKSQALRKEDVVNARAGYRPSVQGYVGYDAHNSMLSQDLTVEDHGWIGGAQLTWNIFDGLRTRGRVIEAQANYERAGIELQDSARRIELEVRTSFSDFIQAREVLESQKKVVEQGEEALRLATARYSAGTGTQLDVLSAQTALTQARSTQVQALHDYDAARARLQRAVGDNLPAVEQSKP